MKYQIRFLLCACVLFMVAAKSAGADPFSIDLNRFTYSYGSTNHTLDFSVASDFIPPVIDPATNYRLVWETVETAGSNAAVDGVYRMSIPQATALLPDPLAISAIGGYSDGRPIGAAPLDWQVSALISNIANASTVNTMYEVHVGGGTYDIGGVNARVEATWFTGDLAGTHYDNVLHIGSDIDLAGYQWDSGDGGIFLTDLNPQDTTLELMVDITNSGQTFSSYYRLDNQSSWNLAQTHTLPSGIGAMTGFADSHPYVAIENFSAVPVPPALWLFGSGLLGLIGVARRKPREARSRAQ